MRSDTRGVGVLDFDVDPPRFVPPQDWAPWVGSASNVDAHSGPVLRYPSLVGWLPRITLDRDWIASEAGHPAPVVLVVHAVRGRIRAVDPSTGETRVLGASDFGTSAVSDPDVRQFLDADPDRPVVVLFDKWPYGLTEQDARSLAQGLRSDGNRRPVFLSIGHFTAHSAGWRSYALVEAPSVQSGVLAQPAGAADARQPQLISYLMPGDAHVVGRLRSFGVSRLLSELGYRDRQQPIVVLASRVGDVLIDPERGNELRSEALGRKLARDPNYLEATRGDWRRPVVILTTGSPNDADLTRNLNALTVNLLGGPDAVRPLYISRRNVSSSIGGRLVFSGGLRALTPNRMQSHFPHQPLSAHTLRIGEASTDNAVGFPVDEYDEADWEQWSSADYDWCGPMLRRTVAEFDPDPVFIFASVRAGVMEALNLHDRPMPSDPVALGIEISRSPAFQAVDGAAPGRTVVIVAVSKDHTPLQDWYAAALAEGLRGLGGPPRSVFVYDGYHIEASRTDIALDRLRNVTPELNWRLDGAIRDVDDPGETVPRYEHDPVPKYDDAGAVAAGIAAVDGQRESVAAGGTRPAAITEVEIGEAYQRWNEDFWEAERTLGALPADWLADLQARARMILGSLWERPEQGHAPAQMELQSLWDRMAQRVAFRLHGDARSETDAWATASAMVAAVMPPPVVLTVLGSGETISYPEWTRSWGFAEVAPDRGRLLFVLGHDSVLTHGELIRNTRQAGVNVLARTSIDNAPQWILCPSDGSEPRRVEPPIEVARAPRAKPLMFFGPDDGATAVAAAALATGLDGVQVVGLHVTPDGQAQWPDGLVGPAESAERIWRNKDYVPGLPVALFGCGAGQRSESDEAPFAQRFARALRQYVWATDASGVWQTQDGAVHATDTLVTGEGRMLPVFADGRGTGQWSLLDRNGWEVGSPRGSELRAAVTGSAAPQYAPNAHPEPVIRWASDFPNPTTGRGRQAGRMGPEPAPRSPDSAPVCK